MSRLANVNTTDIAAAVTLACRRMHRAEVSDLHNGGRYLNALLHAEDLLGVEVEEEYVNQLAGVVFDACSASLPLPASRPRGGTSPTPSLFDPHNTREGLHGLYALVRYRGSAPALDLAIALKEKAVARFYTEEGGFEAPCSAITSIRRHRRCRGWPCSRT